MGLGIRFTHYQTGTGTAWVVVEGRSQLERYDVKPSLPARSACDVVCRDVLGRAIKDGEWRSVTVVEKGSKGFSVPVAA